MHVVALTEWLPRKVGKARLSMVILDLPVQLGSPRTIFGPGVP